MSIFSGGRERKGRFIWRKGISWKAFYPTVLVNLVRLEGVISPIAYLLVSASAWINIFQEQHAANAPLFGLELD